jgi:hypothetical protein
VSGKSRFDRNRRPTSFAVPVNDGFARAQQERAQIQAMILGGAANIYNEIASRAFMGFSEEDDPEEIKGALATAAQFSAMASKLFLVELGVLAVQEPKEPPSDTPPAPSPELPPEEGEEVSPIIVLPGS